MQASAETPNCAGPVQGHSFTFCPRYALLGPPHVARGNPCDDDEWDTQYRSEEGPEEFLDGYDVDVDHPFLVGGAIGTFKNPKANPALRHLLTDNVRYLDLRLVPMTDNALAFVQAIAEQVIRSEKRKTKRRDQGKMKLLRAVGAVVGDLLTAKLLHDAVCMRRLGKTDFADSLTTRHVVVPAIREMERCGILVVHKGYRFKLRKHDAVKGYLTRLIVQPALLELAAAYGITATTVTEAFRETVSTRGRAVHKPVVITALLPRRSRMAGSKGLALRERDMTPADLGRLKCIGAQVQIANKLFGRHVFDGCPVPALYRKFQGSFDLGGRFYCMGQGNFQSANKTNTRPHIRVDGHPLAHVDISAAHLSIACAALGHSIAGTDPYAVPGVDRDIVKAFVTAVIGNGSVQRRWPARRLTEEQHARAGSIADVAEKV